MKKTFITNMPDRAGAFLKASSAISSVGANIVRVSYNKAVDLHMLFIDVAGSKEQLDTVSCLLKELNYISNSDMASNIMLIDFRLEDKPGAVLPILELIEKFDFNISYINSQENGTQYQNFMMGLHITNPENVKEFLEDASRICNVKIIDYDKSKKVLDNTVFYLSFANQIAEKLKLDRKSTNSLIANSNLIMQFLDEKGEPFYKVFNRISKFADLLLKYKGAGFHTRITKNTLPDGVTLYIIEPPCGSNTTILEKNSSLLFVDSGFPCYEEEMKLLLYSLFPNFDKMQKQLVLTHPDIDHCGLISLFDTVYVGAKTYENFVLEKEGKANFREQNKKDEAYCRISKLLTGYFPHSMENMKIIDTIPSCSLQTPLSYIGNFKFEGLVFDAYNGNGGHSTGEIVVVCETLKIVFSGDIVVNIAGFTKEQYEFNKIAPYLMTSVNMVTEKATEERLFMLQKFSTDNYYYCYGHGSLSLPKI